MPRKKEEENLGDANLPKDVSNIEVTTGYLDTGILPKVKKVSKYVGKIKAEKDKLNIFLKEAGLGQNARENVAEIVEQIEEFVRKLMKEE